jgi:uncharacterized protein YqjF (DUF2071 family)
MPLGVLPLTGPLPLIRLPLGLGVVRLVPLMILTALMLRLLVELDGLAGLFFVLLFAAILLVTHLARIALILPLLIALVLVHDQTSSPAVD